MFIRGMSETVKAKLEHFGASDIEPGDILLTNDAYITGSHLNHMTFTVPIFHDGELVGFSCCMAHWPDVGGTLVGGTTDIYSEGLQMPIVKIHRKGVPNEELIDIIRINVRLPERAMGDFRAQIAAVKTGERRFMEMIEQYGRDEVLGGIEAIMDQSEAVARARVRAMPDGVYEAESFMESPRTRLDHLLDDHVGSLQPDRHDLVGSRDHDRDGGSRQVLGVRSRRSCDREDRMWRRQHRGCWCGRHLSATTKVACRSLEGRAAPGARAAGAGEQAGGAEGGEQAERPAGRHLWSTARRWVPRPGP